MKDLEYQQRAIAELIDKTVSLLNIGGTRRKIVFEAPTGAGKTVMACATLAGITDELKNRGNSRWQECAFIWFAPRKLHIQSYGSLKNAFGETRKLRPVMFDELDDSEGIQPGEILFVNWESINKKNNRMTSDSESNASIYEVVRRTREEAGLPIIAVIDEEHMFWSPTADRSAAVLNSINPDVEIRISATPRTQNPDALVKVFRKEVISAEMIKKEVVLNPDIDVDAASPISLDERLLRSALAKREQIAGEYSRLGVGIKPLLLIQLPNDKKESMTDDDTAVAETVKAYLRAKDITTENGKLAVWLDKEKKNLEGLERPDNLAEALLFKEAIALGWDCPRAAVLLIFRKLQSDQFTIQTVGRILRMPEQKHYPSDLLNIGYVYTDIAKDQIKIVSADQDYILSNTLTARRREGLTNVELTAYYAERTNVMRNYLGPDFRKVLYKTAVEFFNLPAGPGLFSLAELAALSGDEPAASLPETEDATINDNRRRAEQQIRLDVKTVNVEIPVDVHFQNEVQTLHVDQAKFARTANEINRVFLAFIATKGGQFEARQGDRTDRIAQYLLGFIEDYLGIYETDAKKVVLYHGNKEKFSRILDIALGEYLKIRNIKKQQAAARDFKTYEWEVPEERTYDSDTNHAVPDVANHALDPFVQLNQASNPEREFAAFLERNSEYIDWWYKNGDAGKMHFSIEYSQGANGSKSLFYVDFVVRMRNGHVYLFDTKSVGSDVFAADKHNALLAYCAEHSTEREPLAGGIILKSGDNWIYSKFPIENTTDNLHLWASFYPQNA